jgi:hypothetical protein
MNDSDRQLHVPEGLVIFGKESLEFLRQPTWEEWQQVMEYLAHCRKTSLRWIADTRHEGRNDFGDEAVAQFEEQLELDLRDLKAAVTLEGMEARKPDDYHSLVAKRVVDHEQQLEWLETAKREKAIDPRAGVVNFLRSSCGRVGDGKPERRNRYDRGSARPV